MKGVILCGGLATRLLPITKSVPKEMMPILNKPVVDYVIDDFRKNGVKDILIILGRNKECLENYYDRNVEIEDRLKQSGKLELLKELTDIYSDVNLTFIRQIDAKGTGHAVKLARNFVGDEPFILSYPDEIIAGNSFAKQLIEEFNKTGSNILPLRPVPIEECVKYGMIDYIDNAGKIQITNIIEKPTPETSPSNISYTGGGVFKKDIFDAIDKCNEHQNGEIYLTDAFNELMERNDVCGRILEGDRIEIGNPLGLIEGNITAALNDDKYRQSLIDFMQKTLDNLNQK